MKNLLRTAAIAVASTALVAGMSASATAAPTADSVAASRLSSASTTTIAIAPYPVDPKSKIRVLKRGKKLTFRLTARFVDDAGTPVAIRKATIQILRGSKWKTLKNLNLNSSGRATYKRTDGKKRKYRMLIKPTALYQGGNTTSVRI